MLEFSHKPVMLEECMEGLALYNGGVWFDGTVGGGGHSYEILKRTAPNGRLIATDLDDEAIAAANKRLGEFNGRFGGLCIIHLLIFLGSHNGLFIVFSNSSI